MDMTASHSGRDYAESLHSHCEETMCLRIGDKKILAKGMGWALIPMATVGRWADSLVPV